MQMVKKFFVGLVITLFALLAFMPKIELYYLLENELNKFDLQLNEEKIEEGIFSLSLSDVSLFGKGVHVAKIDKIKMVSFLGYSQLFVEGVVFDELLQGQVPKKVEHISLIHSLGSWMDVTIDANGTLGEVNGTINLVDRNVRVNFSSIKELSNIRSFLKKDTQGWYYEKSF